MTKIIVTASFFLAIQTLLFALPVNRQVIASSFLVHPLEAVILYANPAITRGSDGAGKWSIPYGHTLSSSGTGNVSWTSTTREGVYPVSFISGEHKKNTSYILVHKRDSAVSREEFAYLLALFLPQAKINVDSNILDLPDNHWSGPALRTCEAYEILKLYPDGLLRPYYPIRRTEAAKMLARLKQVLGLPIKKDKSARKLRDLSKKHWAYDAVSKTMDILPPLNGKQYGVTQTLSFTQARQVFDNLQKHPPYRRAYR